MSQNPYFYSTHIISDCCNDLKKFESFAKVERLSQIDLNNFGQKLGHSLNNLRIDGISQCENEIVSRFKCFSEIRKFLFFR
jgi:hypothetical protein